MGADGAFARTHPTAETYQEYIPLPSESHLRQAQLPEVSAQGGVTRQRTRNENASKNWEEIMPQLVRTGA